MLCLKWWKIRFLQNYPSYSAAINRHTTQQPVSCADLLIFGIPVLSLVHPHSSSPPPVFLHCMHKQTFLWHFLLLLTGGVISIASFSGCIFLPFSGVHISLVVPLSPHPEYMSQVTRHTCNPLTCSFLILSILVTPIAFLGVHESAISNSAAYSFVLVTVSKSEPYHSHTTYTQHTSLSCCCGMTATVLQLRQQEVSRISVVIGFRYMQPVEQYKHEYNCIDSHPWHLRKKSQQGTFEGAPIPFFFSGEVHHRLKHQDWR